MHVIGPKARLRFIPEDYEFIVEQLAGGEAEKRALYRLLGDAEVRDRIFDDETLFRALLDEHRLLSVSVAFYFYIMVRRVFLRAGLEDRELADYVAAMLAEFSRIERMRRPAGERLSAMDYLIDMQAAMQDGDEELRFFLALHIGNVSLFLAGIFPERIEYGAERRGGPSLAYYETMGESHFRVAGGHRLAARYDLNPVVSDLSEAFRSVRLALNDLSERFLMLGIA